MKLFTVLVCVSASLSVGLAVNCDAFLRELSGRSTARDICYNPFSAYLSCLVGKIENAIDTVIAESSPAAQQQAAQCFSSKGCSASYDEQQALNTFLPCPYPKGSSLRKSECIWRHAADKIIEMLQTSPKPVNKCMIKYFKGIGERKIEQCVTEYGGGRVQNYHQPPIPGFEDFELDDLKNVLLYHVMTRYYLGKCTNCNVSAKPGLIDCLAGQARDNDQTVCASRQDCEGAVLGTTCSNRYIDVRDAICSCAAGELKKGIAALENWGELKQVFTRGDWECQLELCYTESGLSGQYPQMAAVVKEVKSSVIKAFLKFQRGDAPRQIAEAMYVFKSILDELVAKWSGLFCGTCNPNEESAEYYRKQAYRKLLTTDACQDATTEFNFRQPETLFRPISQDTASDIDDFFGK